ncbi:unnamed protein product (macronuclear) [Paramecium tetraurelia]|uniref:Uncharacterized protein n=1 Tax=Paramecium tetraurelia TaxID=5888 RepID=A0CK78_PARTE|nr:uncharacterized protein GSPATT00000908001 [Paramecium tetraurelia]CAK71195.1 unnamed protein product [Paramecium tetraurelia]|eukprot:XP_001438592.1 hypothetical protein (macronuclear) [Paramecium tetraurelia strain d4-2]
MIQEQYRFFGKELVNSSGEFQKEKTEGNKPKDLTVQPKYLKFNLKYEEKENQIEEVPNISQSYQFDQSIIKNPQFTPIYNQEIFQYLISQEQKFLVSHNYMNEQRQPDLNG